MMPPLVSYVSHCSGMPPGCRFHPFPVLPSRSASLHLLLLVLLHRARFYILRYLAPIGSVWRRPASCPAPPQKQDSSARGRTEICGEAATFGRLEYWLPSSSDSQSYQSSRHGNRQLTHSPRTTLGGTLKSLDSSSRSVPPTRPPPVNPLS